MYHLQATSMKSTKTLKKPHHLSTSGWANHKLSMLAHLMI